MRSKLISGCLWCRLLLGGVAWLTVCSGNAAEPTYNFGTTPGVIDVGYGILATPMSVLGETLRHDQVLRRKAAEKGLEFRFHPFEKGADTLAPMLAGKLDASMPTDVVALDLVAQADVVLIGYVRQSFSSVVALRGLSMTGLRGKRVGNAPGTSGHNALLQGLAAAGMTERDIVLVTMNVREMPEALLAGKIEAFAAFEPTPSSFMKAHPGKFIPLHRQMSPAYMVIPRRLEEQQPEAAYLLSAALHRAVRWLNRSRYNLELASIWTVKGMQDFLGRDPEVEVRDVAALTRKDFLDVPGVPLIPRREGSANSPLGRSFSFLRSTGKVANDIEWERVTKSIDVRINRHVLGNLDRYKVDEFDYAP